MINNATYAKVIKQFESYQAPTSDPWKRSDGVRLILTPSGYGVREDLEGKLIPIHKSDFIVGRDEHRVRGFIRSLLKDCDVELWDQMRVHRSAVVGKDKRIKSESVAKKWCRLSIDQNRNVAVPPPFVTYLTPLGNLRFRRVLGEVK